MAGRARTSQRGGGRGRGRGAGRPDSGFAVSLRRAAEKAATSVGASATTQAAASASTSEGADVTLVYRRPPRRQAEPVRGRSQTQAAPDAAERHVHFGPTTVHTFDDENAALGSASALATSPVQFWRCCASESHLTQALRECAVKVAGPARSASPVAVSSSAASTTATPLPTLAEIDVTRLRVAIDALIEVRRLLLFPRAGPEAAHHVAAELSALERQSTCWVAQAHAEAVVALVQLCEAAVPSYEPSLASADAARLAMGGSVVASWPSSVKSTTSLTVVPSPVCAAAVARRLRQLVRLCQLTHQYAHVLPPLRRCQDVTDLAQLLFAHSDALLDAIRALAQCESRAGRLTSASASSIVARARTLFAADTFLLLPGLTSRHRLEQGVLAGLLKIANSRDCALDVASWGPMSMLASLKVTQGVYVVQQMARMRVLESVLQEAEFYGLPTFLRSIRRPASSTTAATAHGHMELGAVNWYTSQSPHTTPGSASTLESWLPTVLAPQDSTGPRIAAPGAGASFAHPLSAPSLWKRPAHQLFLCADVLDGERFISPDPMQAPVVQEELIGLCLRHCAYGLVVGEADQIACLLQQSSAYHTAIWQRHLRRALRQLQDSVLKEEEAEDEAILELVGAHGVPAHGSPSPHHHHAVLRDPLGLYARRARAQARDASRRATLGEPAKDGEPRCASVEWLCENRWSFESDACYYGLLYGVVVEENNNSGLHTQTDDSVGHAEGEEAVDPEVPLDVDAVPADALRPAERVTYYVAAVVELRR